MRFNMIFAVIFLLLIALAFYGVAYAQTLSDGGGGTGGGGSPPSGCTNAFQFNAACNSQYLGAVL